jgi:hypothetical protein
VVPAAWSTPPPGSSTACSPRCQCASGDPPEHARAGAWVLALPHRIRFLCAYDPATCAGVRRILVRAVVSFYKRRARDQGIADPRVGCVAFTQRFDSALRLNPQERYLALPPP